MAYLFLDKIKTPQDIKKLNNEQIKVLCREIRDVMVKVVSKNGGHLASNLGVVELTVALHSVFNAPTDSIIFDVGHQCYPHKLLTGRYNEFSSLRQDGGISGFMRPSESVFDPVITGHSSTSVSAAYGILKGNLIQHKDGKSVAVVGDGAFTGGMIYEALNNVGKDKSNLIIVLNDNGMSISKNVGAVARQLSIIRSKPSYHRVKQRAELFVEGIPFVGKKVRRSISRSKSLIKSAIYQGNIFEGLGLQYMGPVDGHDVERLKTIFEVAKNQQRPILIHVITKKGKGYHFSEGDPGGYHGVSPFDYKVGITANGQKDFSSVFGDTLLKIAEKDGKVCAVTAAMEDGTGLQEFHKKFPERFFDVGIAEEHAVTFAAGLATAGMKPVFAVYSSFLQRSYDQIVHDCAIADLPVTICVDRAGIVGNDGETHNGLLDVPFLTSIPNVKVYAPACYEDLTKMLEIRLKNPEGVAAIRYPRGGEPKVPENYKYSEKNWDKFFDGDTAVVSYGTLSLECVSAVESELENTAVYKLNLINSFDDKLISELLKHKKIVVAEESGRDGGIAQKLSLILLERGFKGEYKSAATKGFVSHASVETARKKSKVDVNSIIDMVRN